MINLQKFIDKVQGTEARGLKDVSIPLTEAKAMQAELTRILLELQTYREQIAQQPKDEIIQVSINGGTFK